MCAASSSSAWRNWHIAHGCDGRPPHPPGTPAGECTDAPGLWCSGDAAPPWVTGCSLGCTSLLSVATENSPGREILSREQPAGAGGGTRIDASARPGRCSLRRGVLGLPGLSGPSGQEPPETTLDYSAKAAKAFVC
jgi:hypothetical protein